MTIRYQLWNKTQGEVVAQKVKECRNMFTRIRGLLGTRDLPEQHAYWLIPCNSIHTVGMKYTLDVYFLDKSNRIVSICEKITPGHFSPIVWKAHSVLEFKSGPQRNLRIGDELILEEIPS